MGGKRRWCFWERVFVQEKKEALNHETMAAMGAKSLKKEGGRGEGEGGGGERGGVREGRGGGKGEEPDGKQGETTAQMEAEKCAGEIGRSGGIHSSACVKV